MVLVGRGVATAYAARDRTAARAVKCIVLVSSVVKFVYLELEGVGFWCCWIQGREGRRTIHIALGLPNKASSLLPKLSQWARKDKQDVELPLFFMILDRSSLEGRDRSLPNAWALCFPAH